MVEVGSARVELVLPDGDGADGSGPLPVLFHVPGGGWTHVDETDVWHAFGHAAAADDGWAVVRALYRPAGGGVTAADQAADVAAALGWVAAGGGGRGLGGPLLATGHSAGAHVLALAVARQQDPTPHALVLAAGVYDFAPDVLAADVLQEGVRQALGCTRGCRPAVSLEPAEWVDGDEPPTTLVHGTADRIAPPAGTDRFATALRSVGVPVDVVHVEGGGHLGSDTDEAVRDAVSGWRDQLLRDHNRR